MGMYLVKFGYTTETWARLVASPEDRREAVAAGIAAGGGKLHGLWYAFGEDDGYTLFEAPNDTVAAALLLRVTATGAYRHLSTTKLITVEEALEAMREAGGVPYRAPGEAESA